MTTRRAASHPSTKKASFSTTTRKSSAKQSAAPRKPIDDGSTAEHESRCWPGFEPVPGKKRNEKGSCEPKAGKQSKSVRRADQKAAAASKLQKTDPR